LTTLEEAIAGDVSQEQCCLSCGGTQVKTLFRATDRLYRTTDKEFLVVECAHCHLIRLYPFPSPAELPQYYPANYWYSMAAGADQADRLAETYRRVVLGDHLGFAERALEDSKEHGPVLDVGCGGGLFLRMLRDRKPGRPMVGLDFSVDAARLAWHVNGVPVTNGMLTSAPFANSSMAMVTMYHVLEHLYNPASYLEAAHRLLKPDGRLVVQVPNASCWQFVMFGENWAGVDVPRHLVNFKVKDLDKLLASCGFEVLRHKYFSLRDNPAGLATTLAPGLDPMARRIRGVEEGPQWKLVKDLAYFALVAASVPFTVLEAACAAGSTVMVEARKKR
jgi:SAM-dependent methyltransferase